MIDDNGINQAVMVMFWIKICTGFNSLLIN